MHTSTEKLPNHTTSYLPWVSSGHILSDILSPFPFQYLTLPILN